MRGENGRKKEVIGKERKTHWRKNGKKAEETTGEETSKAGEEVGGEKGKEKETTGEK